MKSLRIILLLAMCTLMACLHVDAQSMSLKATISQIKVDVNGNMYENRNLKWPILQYNGKYYFPMTYSSARHLGVEFATVSGQRTYKATDISAIFAPDMKKQTKNTVSATFSKSLSYIEAEKNPIKLNQTDEFIY